MIRNQFPVQASVEYARGFSGLYRSRGPQEGWVPEVSEGWVPDLGLDRAGQADLAAINN